MPSIRWRERPVGAPRRSLQHAAKVRRILQPCGVCLSRYEPTGHQQTFSYGLGRTFRKSPQNQTGAERVVALVPDRAGNGSPRWRSPLSRIPTRIPNPICFSESA